MRLSRAAARAVPAGLLLAAATTWAEQEADSVAVAPPATTPAAIAPPDATPPATTPPDTSASRSSVVPLPALLYSPETGIGGGALVLWTFRLGDSEASRRRPSTVTPLFLITQKRQIVARVTGDIYSRGGSWRYTGRVGGARFPDRFWGIGNDTSDELEEEYTPVTLESSLGVQRLLPRDWFVGVETSRARRRLQDLEEGGLIDSGEVPGAEDGRIVGLGLRLRRDTRDWSIAPTGGGTFEVAATAHPAALGSDFEYDGWSVDLRRYVGIGRTVLAGRVLGVFTASGDPPFDLLPALGGDSLLRGYYAGRYRDRHLAAVQLEIRVPIWWRLGVIGFGSAGQVAPEVARFAPDRFHPAAGFGVRFRPKEEDRTSLRFDWGFGENRSGFYFGLGEAF